MFSICVLTKWTFRYLPCQLLKSLCQTVQKIPLHRTLSQAQSSTYWFCVCVLSKLSNVIFLLPESTCVCTHFLNVFLCFSFSAIFNEQQVGNCNVAVKTFYCLLLCNVYSASFGVSAFSVLWYCTHNNDNSVLFSFIFFINCECISECMSFNLCCFSPYAAANFYQRALLANALTSALRLHQRLPRFQLSRAFLAQALQEDSCHYLLYSLILVNSYPITSILLLPKSLMLCFCLK